MYILNEISNQLGISKYQLSLQLNIPPSTMRGYVTGRRRPSDKIAYELIDKLKLLGFEITLEDLRPRTN